MIGQAPHSPFSDVPGWLFGNEEQTLADYAAQLPKGAVIVEIGVEFGRSTAALGLHAPDDAKHYCVDLFPSNHPTWGDMAFLHKANLKEAGYERFTQLAGDSAMVGLDFDHPIDLLFVDGDHSYAGVMRDIQVWTPKIKPGGVVLFHDAAPETNLSPHHLHFEVQKAINDWQSGQHGEWEELPSEFSVRVFRRLGDTNATKELETAAEKETAEAPKVEKPKTQKPATKKARK